MFNADNLVEKWGPVLEHGDLNPIKDHWRKSVTAQILENQQNFLQEAPANNAPSLDSRSWYRRCSWLQPNLD